MLEESEDIHNDLEAMTEKLQYLDSVYHTETMSQQVADLGRETEELRQVIRIRLQSLHDAAKVKKKKKKLLKWQSLSLWASQMVQWERILRAMQETQEMQF